MKLTLYSSSAACLLYRHPRCLRERRRRSAALDLRQLAQFNSLRSCKRGHSVLFLGFAVSRHLAAPYLGADRPVALRPLVRCCWRASS
jgi:hypothetical protein